MDIGIATKIKTKTVSKTKMAIATAYLGAAVLAASGADIQMSKPDIVIDRIVMNEQTPYAPADGNKITVYYSNRGSVANTEPFTIGVSIRNGAESEERVQHVVDYKEYSQRHSAKLLLLKEKFSDMYAVPVNRKFASEQNKLAGLNEYYLEPNATGQVQLIIPKTDGVGSFRIRAAIDFTEDVLELQEDNNAYEIEVF